MQIASTALWLVGNLYGTPTQGDGGVLFYFVSCLWLGRGPTASAGRASPFLFFSVPIILPNVEV